MEPQDLDTGLQAALFCRTCKGFLLVSRFPVLAHGIDSGVTVVCGFPRSLSVGARGDSAFVCPLALQESLFPARVVYDLLFFFIVIIIVLNLIFGVIIDTFADLRSEKQKKEEILKTTCFICGEAHFLARLFPTARPEASKP